MKAQETGRLGEREAARYLRRLGYKLLDLNYRCRYGEIDIVAQDGGTVVFVEVKTRKNPAFAPAGEAVTPLKQQKLRTTAQQWLADNGEYPARFDVIEIYTDTARLHHIKDAFA